MCLTVSTFLGKIQIYVPIAEDDVLMMETPGGGGYGDPLDRDPELVAEDLLEEKIDSKEARNIYRVVWDPVKRQIDSALTETLRMNAKR